MAVAGITLQGGQPLTAQNVDRLVQRRPGVYVLGSPSPAGGNPVAKYAGRSDDDLNGRLKQWEGRYPLFWFCHCSSAADAYQAECRLYHHYGGGSGGLDNKVHPAKPAGGFVTCPVTGCQH